MEDLKIIKEYYKMFLKKQFMYRFNLSILISDIIMQILGLIFLWTIFVHVPDINGWGYYEVLLMYGLAQFNFSFFSLFAGNIFRLSEKYIVKGDLTKLLIRPMNSLLQLTIENMYLGDAGAMIVGLFTFLYAITNLNLSISVFTVLSLIFWIFITMIIQFSFFTIISSINFWQVGTMGFHFVFFRNIESSRFPLTIYNKVVKIIFTLFIPIGFIGYYPAVSLSNVFDVKLYILGLTVAFLMFNLALKVWSLGLKKYNATGW